MIQKKENSTHDRRCCKQKEKNTFLRPSDFRKIYKKPAKTIIESGLLKEGKVNNIEEAKKKASESIEGENLTD